MGKLVKDLFTGIDGETWDLGRILLALGCTIMSVGGIDVIVTGSLDFVAFGGGFGGLLAGGGALLMMKRDTEPSGSTKTKVGIDNAGVSSSIESEEKH